MPLSPIPVPPAPGPKARYLPSRESDTLRVVDETQARLLRLVEALEPFMPQELVDASGKIFQVLARDFGQGTATSLSSLTPAHPFKVSIQVAPGSDPPTLERIVEHRSQFILTGAPLSYLTITGLATVDEPGSADAGWATFIADDLIWLEVAYVDGVPDTAAIKSYGAGDTWDEASLVEPTDAEIETARWIIARAPADSDGAPRLVQCQFGDIWAEIPYQAVLFTNGLRAGSNIRGSNPVEL